MNEPVKDELARAIGRPILGKPRGRLLELATGICGISPENVRIGGPPSDNVAIDEEGTNTLLRLAGLSLLIGLTLAYLSFSSIRVAFMLFFVGGVAAIASLSYVWFGGYTMDAILMSMPSLIYVLGLSSAVHIVNYYRDACYEDGPELAVETAVAHSWFPCTLAAFTTALGVDFADHQFVDSDLQVRFVFGHRRDDDRIPVVQLSACRVGVVESGLPEKGSQTTGQNLGDQSSGPSVLVGNW